MKRYELVKLRGLINVVRYNYFVSIILVFTCKPLYWISTFCSRIIKDKIKVNGVSVVFDGKKIYFPRNVGVGINSKIYWNGSQGFEPLTSKTLVFFFRRSEIFFDIGSNFGFYSVLAQKINNDLNVFCFEPLPNIYNDNLSFHKANKATNQEVYNLAVSDQAASVHFFVPDVYNIDSEITSASIEKNFQYNKAFRQKQISVNTIMLDKILDAHELRLKSKKLILKIDVEGHERAVLEGGFKFFKELRPFVVLEIDRNGDNVNSLWLIFQSLEYSIYSITSVGYFKLNQKALLDYKGGNDFLLIPNEIGSNDYLSFDVLISLLSKLDG